MIFIPRRKLVVFMLFCIIFALTTFIMHHQSTNVFSDKLSGRIVLDAGHGLPDGGAIGATGTVESTLNINIAKRVEKELTKDGYTVIMTRTGENSITDKSGTIAAQKKDDMHERLKIINTSDADIFVSIHMNKYSLPTRRGAQVFYKKGDEFSKLLAESLQSSFNQMEEATRECSALTGDYYILNCTNFPSAIAECGFLSSPEDEALLITEEYQDSIAYGIFKGIIGYLAQQSNSNNS